MSRAIAAPARAVVFRVALAAGLCAALGAGCVKIDGGAVEVSWVVRSDTGAAITDCGCASPAIATVRLVLVLDQGGMPTSYRPCDGQAQCDFPCPRQTGSTAFDIRPTQPDESYEISVIGVDSTGTPIPGVQSALILRSVVTGQPTQTEAFELVAQCSAACMMNGSGVCARP
jgi:hypothetical protein